MTTKKKLKPGKSKRLTLAARATITHAPELQTALLAWIGDGRPLLVDGSRVEEIDTATLQLLMGALKACRARGLRFGWESASAPLRRAASIIGLTKFLELDETSAAIGSA